MWTRNLGRHFALRLPADQDGVESDLSQSNMKCADRHAQKAVRQPVRPRPASSPVHTLRIPSRVNYAAASSASWKGIGAVAEKGEKIPKPASHVFDAALKKLEATIQGAPAAQRNELIQKVVDAMAALGNPETGT